jgi:hypothetical protein
MTSPQRPYFSTQDVVAPNIDLYHSKVILDIDRFRSRFNGTTANLSQTISTKNLDSVFANNEANSLSPQESRCNAFYRMIGFPVVSADGTSLYSPGHDPDLNRDKDRIAKNLEIANSILGKLKFIFDDREFYPKNSANIFQNKDVNGSALAISSLYVRPFDKQFKEGIDPLSTDFQVFNVPGRKDVSANFSETVNYSIQSKHILKPFMVDPRTEYTVTPAMNRICAPFLSDKSKTQLTRSNYLKRPYIERVIRVRFNNLNVLAPAANKESINQFVNDLVVFIKANSEIKKPTLVESTGDSLKSLHKSEVMVYGKFIRIIEALIIQLAQAFIEIDKIRQQINWKPIPHASGPEFGSVLNKVNKSDKLNNKKIEQDITELTTQKFLEETDFDIGLSDPDLGNFSFSNVDDIVFGSLKNVSQFYDKQLSTLNRRRDESGKRANELLRKIEIITGEFSGLGLLDIIAIQAALWVIKPEALLGLVDDAAIDRMKKSKQLQTELTLPDARLPPQDSLMEFEKKLSEIYVLMDAFYQDEFKVGGKNK